MHFNVNLQRKQLRVPTLITHNTGFFSGSTQNKSIKKNPTAVGFDQLLLNKIFYVRHFAVERHAPARIAGHCR